SWTARSSIRGEGSAVGAVCGAGAGGCWAALDGHVLVKAGGCSCRADVLEARFSLVPRGAASARRGAAFTGSGGGGSDGFGFVSPTMASVSWTAAAGVAGPAVGAGCAAGADCAAAGVGTAFWRLAR